MYAVFIGGCLGHFCCTLAAIIFGAAIAKKVSMTICKFRCYINPVGITLELWRSKCLWINYLYLNIKFHSVNLCGGLLFLGFSAYTFYLAATGEND